LIRDNIPEPGTKYQVPITLLMVVFETAALLMVPADQGQRAAFERLMPRLYIKGSFHFPNH
jgi:hypothetical protein